MTDKQRIALEWAKLPATIIALAGILFFIANATFATDAELLAVERRVTVVEATLGNMQRDVRLIACMHLAEAQGTRWENCVDGYGAK